MRTIILGKDQVSLINPPTEGSVVDNGTGTAWLIGRNSDGRLVLRRPDTREPHPDFLAGMDLETFCYWINSR